jgi:16S rRNA processing protein RimM
MRMLITIGKAVKPFGVRGELKIEPLTDFPERFTDLRSVHLISPSGEALVCAVKSVRHVGNRPVLAFEGYETPEKAKALNGWFLKVPEEETVPLPEGVYYRFELVGMEVFSEAGERLGRITDVFETGGNDVYIMKREGKSEVYLPAVKEIVRQIDREKKRMTIRVIDGLLE